jgi:hypothetical protein
MSLAAVVDDFMQHLVRTDIAFPHTSEGLERYRTLMSGIYFLLFPQPDTYKPLEEAIEDAAKEYNVSPARFTEDEEMAIAAMDEFLSSAWVQIRANPEIFQDALSEHVIAEISANNYVPEENYNYDNDRKYTYFYQGRRGGARKKSRKTRKARKGSKRRMSRRV